MIISRRIRAHLVPGRSVSISRCSLYQELSKADNNVTVSLWSPFGESGFLFNSTGDMIFQRDVEGLNTRALVGPEPPHPASLPHGVRHEESLAGYPDYWGLSRAGRGRTEQDGDVQGILAGVSDVSLAVYPFACLPWSAARALK